MQFLAKLKSLQTLLSALIERVPRTSAGGLSANSGPSMPPNVEGPVGFAWTGEIVSAARRRPGSSHCPVPPSGVRG